MSQIQFRELGLSNETMLAIDAMGFSDATEIQHKAIPAIKEGRDIIGKSQTGTGKTLAFGIPAIEAIDKAIPNKVQVLILCPTRELAMQATGEIIRLSKFQKHVSVVDVYGGAPMERQITRLKFANIVVGTPGRIMDHLRRRTLKLQDLKMIVLDEADEMLSMGFRDDIETILQDAPEQRQTILFSATMPTEILALTKKFQKNPTVIEINKKQVTVENISQCYYLVPPSKKMAALSLMFMYYKPRRSMIFCNTKKMVDVVTEYLQANQIRTEGLHGDMKQTQRNSVMNAFKKGTVQALVATDVAARGIDVNDIDYVINYDIPQNIEYYVHRIGRTGRAGKSGKAITICSGRSQSDILLRIGRLVKARIEQKKLPKTEEILKNQYANNLVELETQLENIPELPHYTSVIEDLVSKGYDLTQIAISLMQLHFGERDKKIEELSSIDSIESIDYSGADSYQKIVINVGKLHRVAANHIVGAITGSAGLTGKEIGKIQIFDKKAIVDIPRKKATQVIKQMQNCKICGNLTTTILHQVSHKGPDRFGPRKPSWPGHKNTRNK